MARIEYQPLPPIPSPTVDDLNQYLQNELIQIQSFISSVSGDKGVASAWVAFDGDGDIESSYKVESVVKTGTGKFNITFTTPAQNADYCAVTSASSTTGGGRLAQVYDKTNSAFKVATKTSTNVDTDPRFINVAIYEDR